MPTSNSLLPLYSQSKKAEEARCFRRLYFVCMAASTILWVEPMAYWPKLVFLFTLLTSISAYALQYCCREKKRTSLVFVKN